MKKVLVKMPASCGEWVQGIYDGREALTSYAIDLFNTVTLTSFSDKLPCKTKKHDEKIEQAFKLGRSYFGLGAKNLCLSVSSAIPRGKGMASSTADVAGVLVALGVFSKKKFSIDEIASLAAKIEPTDSTMFREWVVFDHINGQVIKSLGYVSGLSVLVLEAQGALDTKKFREDGGFLNRKAKGDKKMFSYMEKGCRLKNSSLLARGALTSALYNQAVLKKPYLKEIQNLATDMGFLGINVAHSGTVVGVLFKKDQVNLTEFLQRLAQKGYKKVYPQVRIHQIIKGGPRVFIKKEGE